MDRFPVIAHLCHQPQLILLLVLILGLAGFVSGLAGFGFGLVGASVLWILPPREGIPLVMLLSACSQILSIARLRASMPPLREWWPDGPAPCILAGFLGMSAGLWLLVHLNANLISSIIGLAVMGCSVCLIVRSANMRSRPMKRTLSGALLVGLLGGAFGGLCANPGPVMVIWSNLLGMNKEEQRATVQPFILAIQLMALLVFVIRGGVFSGCLGILWVSSLLVILITTNLGVALFRRFSDSGYSRLVLLLLVISGGSLIAKGWGFWNGLLAKVDHFVFSL